MNGSGSRIINNDIDDDNNNNHNDPDLPTVFEGEEQVEPMKKKLRKSVLFDETQNEQHEFITTNTSTNGEILLQQAEQQLQQQNQKQVAPQISLTVTGIQNFINGLYKVYEKNKLQRAKVEAYDNDNNDDTNNNISSLSKNAMIYMESEILLYEYIIQLKTLALDPIVYYPILLIEQNNNNNNIISNLFTSLLLHDNIDIIISVISVFVEWFDTDVIADIITVPIIEDNDNNDSNITLLIKKRNIILQLAYQIVNECGEMIVDNLGRMMIHHNNDTTDADDDVGRGIDDVITLFENLFELDTISSSSTTTTTSTSFSIARKLCETTNLLSWIFTTQQQDSNNNIYRNRSMELLTYITTHEDIYSIPQLDWIKIKPYISSFDNNDNNDNNNKNNNDTVLYIDGIEILLQSVGQFRKRQPKNDDEMEYLENCCIVLTSILMYSNTSHNNNTNTTTTTTQSIISTFINAQGVELVLRCLKERVHAGAVTLQWLDINNSNMNEQCRYAYEYMINIGILKYIFPLFMGKNLPKLYSGNNSTSTSNNTNQSISNKEKKRKHEYYHKIEITTIRILYNLTRYIHDDSPNDMKQRLITKFIDSSNNNEKINQCITLLLKYDQQVRLAEYKFFQSDVEEILLQQLENGQIDQNQKDTMLQLALLDAKLKAGGDILHRLAAIIAFCCVGSKKFHEQIIIQLQQKELGISLIRDTLQEFVSVLDDTSDQKQTLQHYLEQI